jgi:hypothetical protein
MSCSVKSGSTANRLGGIRKRRHTFKRNMARNQNEDKRLSSDTLSKLNNDL